MTTENTKALIWADVARCNGFPLPICEQCARRLQIERDDPKRWFPMMVAGKPPKTTCIYRIQPKEGQKNDEA